MHTFPNLYIKTNKNAVHLNLQKFRWDLLGVGLDHLLIRIRLEGSNEATPNNSYIAQV
jgi:hypothetical protein